MTTVLMITFCVAMCSYSNCGSSSYGNSDGETTVAFQLLGLVVLVGAELLLELLEY